MGNIFASYVIKGELKASTMKSGIEYMTFLADWYQKNSEKGAMRRHRGTPADTGGHRGTEPKRPAPWFWTPRSTFYS